MKFKDRVDMNGKMLTFFTDCIWVTNITSLTYANSSVVVGTALGINATGSCEARILALFLNTCEVDGALWINCAFRPCS